MWHCINVVVLIFHQLFIYMVQLHVDSCVLFRLLSSSTTTTTGGLKVSVSVTDELSSAGAFKCRQKTQRFEYSKQQQQLHTDLQLQALNCTKPSLFFFSFLLWWCDDSSAASSSSSSLFIARRRLDDVTAGKPGAGAFPPASTFPRCLSVVNKRQKPLNAEASGRLPLISSF